jgi:carbon-monoxide dehydrogenase small subunit
MKEAVVLQVNGQEYSMEIESNRLLVDVLREDLRLTGTKINCGIGVCGACTVLLDGKAVNSCLMLAMDAVGRKITTIEGLTEEAELHPLQEAFVNHGAIQCGFCSPGMILSAKALLDENPKAKEIEIRRAISGNLCRCTGYTKIVEAIQSQTSTRQRRRSES